VGDHWLADVILASTSGLASDRVVNTFHFETFAPTAATIASIHAALASVYTTTHAPGTSPLGGAYGASIAPAGHTIRTYDMTDPIPRIPNGITTFAIVPAATQMPREVALCLSFRGLAVPGVEPARQRGRVYFGPFARANTVANDATGGPAVTAGDIVDKLRGAATYLKGASDAAADWTWVVYSTVDNAMYPVDNGWVDNSWDTQRRRGVKPTARYTF